MDLDELATTLREFGCPSDKAPEMAAQLDKRAQQLVEERGQSYTTAMNYLIGLMRQGWAAQEKGVQP
ncbi:MAG: hypothetical protein ACPGVU_01080 [Limisphaerales bacterium]